MQGDDGDRNLKFVSNCGKYEAVYNKNFEILSDRYSDYENQYLGYNQDIGVYDPINMGTYNYCGSEIDAGKHHKLDVIPYENWGNIDGYDGSTMFEATKIYFSVKASATIYWHYIASTYGFNTSSWLPL
jgi:hypothetical protein